MFRHFCSFRFFNDVSCGTTLGYYGLMDGMCMSFGSGANSVYVDFPTISFWQNSPTCSGSPTDVETAFRASCGSASTMVFDDDATPNFAYESGALMNGCKRLVD